MRAKAFAAPRKRTTPAIPPPSANSARLVNAVSVAVLAALAVAVFAPVRHFEFVSWDDPFYVTDNPVVRQGLTTRGLSWALTAADRFYWHPVTWLSHMTDVQLFGVDAGAAHVVNLVLHVCATLLLYGALRRMTGHAGRSLFVAALFAVHPLRVESVAWVSERKDVLSGVFWMISLWAYWGYVRFSSRSRYAVLVASFALGVMSKPAVVTLPIVLLLLDVWPLCRLTWANSAVARATVPRLVVEKIPLLVLAAAGSLVTFITQSEIGAVQGLDIVPASVRVSNAMVSLAAYIGMVFWPTGLAAFYPFRPLPAWQVVLSAVILLGVSYAAIRFRRSHPYLMVGWLWYVVTVLPVIGIVQVGSQSMADRFMYLPLIGLLIAVTWGAADLLDSWRVRGYAVAAVAIAVVAACALAARAQVWHWKDSRAVWQRAIDVVPNNDRAHANLGLVLATAGETDLALAHFSEALRIVGAPDQRAGVGRGAPPREYAALLHDQIGRLLGRQGRYVEAAGHFREVVRLEPANAEARRGLGQALASSGQLPEAVLESREAVRLEPSRAELHGDLAAVLYRAGDLPGAIAELEEGLRLDPSHGSAAKWHYNLAAMYNDSGRTTDAVKELEAALALDPRYDAARRALTALRSTRRVPQ